MNHKEAYLILSVPYGTDIKTCESEARQLSLAFHPDKGVESFVPRFRRVREAIEFLRENPTAPQETSIKRSYNEFDDIVDRMTTDIFTNMFTKRTRSQTREAPPPPPPKPVSKTVRELSVPASLMYTGGTYHFSYMRNDESGKHVRKTDKKIRLVFPPRTFTLRFEFSNGGHITKPSPDGEPVEAGLCIHIFVAASCGWALVNDVLVKTVLMQAHEWGKEKLLVEMPDGTSTIVAGPAKPGSMEYFKGDNFAMTIQFKEKPYS